MSEINIAPKNVSGTCNYKCMYKVNYKKQPITVTNYGSFLGLSNNLNNSCFFNNNELKLESIKITRPSSLNYNNNLTDAELTMLSKSTTGGNSLKVCIPISLNGVGSEGSQILSNILTVVSKQAPSKGESTNSGIPEFSLNAFIPKSEFYSFTDSNSNIDYVVFGLSNAIYISSQDLDILGNVLSYWTNVEHFKNIPEMFINKDGPIFGTGVQSDEIYIDCQPTDSSEEEVLVSYKKPTNNDLVKFVKSEGFQITALVIFGVILLYLIYKRFSNKV